MMEQVSVKSKTLPLSTSTSTVEHSRLSVTVRNKNKKKKKKKFSRKAKVALSEEEIRAKLQSSKEKIEKDNDLLRRKIRKITSNSFNPKLSSQIGVLVNSYNDQADNLSVKCQEELGNIKEYEVRIERLVKEIRRVSNRNKKRGDKAREEILDKQIKVLENRLDVCKQKYNQVISFNRSKRDEIERLKSEKVVFDKIYHKMEMELHSKQKELSELIEKSNNAFEDREKINRDLQNIRKHAKMEETKFEKKIKVIDGILQDDAKVNMHLKLKERNRLKQTKTGGGDLSAEEQQLLKSKFIKGNWKIAEKKAKEIILLEKIKRYEKMFEKIESKTKIKKEELIKKLQSDQKRCFDEFMYINKLNGEVELLKKDIAFYSKEMETYTKNKKNGTQKQLISIQKKIALVQDMGYNYMKKTKLVQQKINTIAPKVNQIFELLNFPPTLLKNVNSNLTLQIKRIEQSVCELVKMKKDGKVTCGAERPKVNRNKFFSTPLTGMEDDDSTANLEVPLTREELMMDMKKKPQKIN